jgi:hypothetical protein
MTWPNTLPVAALTVDQFESLMTECFRRALDECPQSNDAGPVLLDREGLARALGCSAGMVDKLRKQGLPTRRVGDVPRFLLSDVLAWLPADVSGASTANA